MKMNKEELKFYKKDNKKIKIILKNNFRYRGTISELFDDSLKFEDRFEGFITIPYEEIRLIGEDNSEETGGAQNE